MNRINGLGRFAYLGSFHLSASKCGGESLFSNVVLKADNPFPEERGLLLTVDQGMAEPDATPDDDMLLTNSR